MSRWLRPIPVECVQSSKLPIEYYPNAYGGRTKAADPGDGYEPDLEHINCAQCGFSIENRNTFKSCPHCGSDNFEGGALTY